MNNVVPIKLRDCPPPILPRPMIFSEVSVLKVFPNVSKKYNYFFSCRLYWLVEMNHLSPNAPLKSFHQEIWVDQFLAISEF